MSTILRGYTSIQNKSKIVSQELKVEIKTSKDGRALFIIDIADKNFTDFEGQITTLLNIWKKINRLCLPLKATLGSFLGI